MKTKFLSVCIFLLIISCSPKSNLEISVKDIKKEGVTILQNKSNLNTDEVFDVVKISLSDVEKKIINWNYPNFNSSNLLPHIEFNNSFKISKTSSFFNNVSKNIYKKDILIHEGKIIFIDDYSNIVVLDENFKLVNKYQVHKKKYFSDYHLKFSIIVNNNILYVSDNLGFIYAYNLKSNEVVWKNNLGVPFLSNLAIYKNDIYVINSNGKIFSINSLNGNQNWSFETGSDTAKSYNAFKLAVANDKLIFSNDFGIITCIDLEKQSIIWNLTMEPSSVYSDNNLFEIASPVIANNDLFLVSSYGKFQKLDLNTAKIYWSINESTSLTPLINNEIIAVANHEGFFSIYNKNSGKILYKKNIINYLRSNKIKTKSTKIENIFVASNKFYLITNDGYIITIDSKNLESVNYQNISDSFKSNPAIVNNILYLVGDKETIYKIQ